MPFLDAGFLSDRFSGYCNSEISTSYFHCRKYCLAVAIKRADGATERETPLDEDQSPLGKVGTGGLYPESVGARPESKNLVHSLTLET